MPKVEIHGRTVGYNVYGERQPAMLLLSGYRVGKDDWWPSHIELLASRREVIVVDNRGVGESSVPNEPYAILDLAHDAVSLLDHLGLDDVHLFGSSMGGMIAQQLVLTYPERVRSLTLASTAFGAFGQPNAVPPSMEVVAALRKPPSGDRRADLLEGLWLGYPAAFTDENPEFVETFIAHRMSCPEPDPAALDLQFKALLETHDTEARLGEITCPTLVLAGSEDVMIPAENSRRLAARIPNAELVIYAGCGHGFLEQTGSRAFEDVLAFIARVEDGRSG